MERESSGSSTRYQMERERVLASAVLLKEGLLKWAELLSGVEFCYSNLLVKPSVLKRNVNVNTAQVCKRKDSNNYQSSKSVK